MSTETKQIPRKVWESLPLQVKRSLSLLFITALFVIVSCSPVQLDPGVNPVDTQPTNVPTLVSEEGTAGDPPDPDAEETQLQEQETSESAAEPTPPTEADATREAILKFDNYSVLETAQERAAFREWAEQANFGAWDSPESFRVISPTELEVIGGFSGDNTYQEGDHIVRTQEPPYTFTYNKLAYDGTKEVELDDSYHFSIDAGVPTWSSSNKDKNAYPDYIFVDWYKDGEFLTAEFTEKLVEETQMEADMASAQAFAQAHDLAPVDHVEYADGIDGHTTAYDAEGNALAERANADAAWVEVEAEETSGWLFGSPELEHYEFEDMMEIPAGTMAAIRTYENGWSYVPFDSEEVLTTLGLESADQILAPGELNQLTTGVINSRTWPVKMENIEDGIGTNQQLYRVSPVVPRGIFEFIPDNKPHLKFVGFTGYTWSTDVAGNPLLLVDQLTVKREGLERQKHMDYAVTLRPDGSIDFVRSEEFQAYLWQDAEGNTFNSFEEFIAYVTKNPDKPVVAYLLGVAPDDPSEVLGQGPPDYDSGTFSSNAEDYGDDSRYRQMGRCIQFEGFYLPPLPDTSGD